MDSYVEEAIVARLGESLEVLEVSDKDASAFEAARTWMSRGQGDAGFFDYFADRGPVPVGVWVLFLRELCSSWHIDEARDHAVALPALRELHPGERSGPIDQLLGAVCATLEVLSWIDYEAKSSSEAPLADQDDESDSETPLSDSERESVDLPRCLFETAICLQPLDQPDRAYDLIALTLGLSASMPPSFRKEAARRGVDLGLAANRSHQVALCSVEAAVAALDAADERRPGRLQAFNACELAIERLRQTGEPYRAAGASRLLKVALPQQYLGALLVPMCLLLDDGEPLKAKIATHFPGREWTPRIAQTTAKARVQDLELQLAVQQIDWEIEAAMRKLEEPARQRSSSANAITWTIDHPAHRRAVPLAQSFLREQQFDNHLVELTHEVTHVLSLLGHLGAALTCLRVANIENEATLWSLHLGRMEGGDQNLDEQASRGPAPLADGEPGLLMRADLRVELAAKARTLQDVWAPWFEGLALFGETAADPSRDPSRINGIAEALRAVVDFIPTSDATEDSIREEFEKYVSEFEERASRAMRRRGPSRLGSMLRRREDPYFSGYVAVRTVLATWRQNYSSGLEGALAFDLLMHATRYGTSAAIPDLSLPSAEFERQAITRMAAWVQGLAGLSADALGMFFSPIGRSEAGKSLQWDGFTLRSTADIAGDTGERQVAWLKQRLEQALQSLLSSNSSALGDDDADRIARDGAKFYTEYRATPAWHEERERYREVAQQLINRGSFLPIARTDSLFYVVLDLEGQSFLILQLRTTEAHVDTGNPSTSALWLPISTEAARAIEAHHKATAEPRMQVSRVIDLGGVIVPGQSLHVLALRYGEWFDLRGSMPAIQSVLSEHEHLPYFRDVLRRRLYPTPTERTVSEDVFVLDEALDQTLTWLSCSTTWQVHGCPVRVGKWVDQIRGKAERARSEAVRRSVVLEASRRMLTCLFPMHADLVGCVVDRGFEAWTSRAPELRSDILELLLRSGHSPAADGCWDAVVQASDSVDIGLFKRESAGWDIRPAAS